MLSIPKVTIGVLVYNHEKYIRECLQSIVNQIGNFHLKIVIHDDCSTDSSEQKIKEFLSAHAPSEKQQIVYHRHLVNLGGNGVKNFGSLIPEMQGSDYFALIDGDDYYSSFIRIAQHLQLHQSNPDLSISYNSLQFYYESTEQFVDYIAVRDADFSSTEDLIQENFIGNLGCAFYNSKFLNKIPENLFEQKCFDWFFCTYYSQFGRIARLNKPLNIYRKHDKGLWTGLDSLEASKILINYISDYNKYLNYKYDSSYSVCKESLGIKSELDLLIVNDIFPHPQSGFSLQEITSILQEMPNARVYCRGLAVSILGKESLPELVQQYKLKNPELDSQIQTIPYANSRAKLLYINFLSTAYDLVIINNYQIPFVVTIYPGGGFAINSPEVDARIREVFNSPYFRKVIVTQQVTYDYLVNNGFCTKDQVEFIFGVVTPETALKKQYPNKQYYGFDKESLDICFVAHRYTEYGQDKGYDTFIKVAQLLAASYPNINFHVVGPWNKDIIDVSEIQDRITFYGSQEQDWFDQFYLDKDLILSPNIPNQICAGSFDGFPTGCATDAALRGVAIFCTDPLYQNQNRFTLNEDIVIITSEAEIIKDEIVKYYENPKQLRRIAQNGAIKVRQLYNYDVQIAPRIKVLKEEILKSCDYYSTVPMPFSDVPILPEALVLPESIEEIIVTHPIPVPVTFRKKVIRKVKTVRRLVAERKYSELYQNFNYNVEKVINRYTRRH